MTELREFSEVGHCGGTLTVTVVTSPEGNKQYQLGYKHSSPRPSSISSVFSTFEGEPIAFVAIGGMGAETNTPAVPGISTLLASDEHGLYGHECPRCKGYWRTDGFPVYWVTTCPYCALRAPPHYFLTKGQRKYIEECCKLVVDAMEKPDGDYVIDFDAVAVPYGRARRRQSSTMQSRLSNTSMSVRRVDQFKTFLASTDSAHLAGRAMTLWWFARD